MPTHSSDFERGEEGVEENVGKETATAIIRFFFLLSCTLFILPPSFPPLLT